MTEKDVFGVGEAVEMLARPLGTRALARIWLQDAFRAGHVGDVYAEVGRIIRRPDDDCPNFERLIDHYMPEPPIKYFIEHLQTMRILMKNRVPMIINFRGEGSLNYVSEWVDNTHFFRFELTKLKFEKHIINVICGKEKDILDFDFNEYELLPDKPRIGAPPQFDLEKAKKFAFERIANSSGKRRKNGEVYLKEITNFIIEYFKNNGQKPPADRTCQPHARQVLQWSRTGR